MTVNGSVVDDASSELNLGDLVEIGTRMFVWGGFTSDENPVEV